jgi:hypothetical protein
VPTFDYQAPDAIGGEKASVSCIRRTRPAIMAAALAAALAGGLAACTAATSTGPAGSRSPAAGGDPLAGLSADDIATQAWANTKAAASVHVTGSGTDSGKPLTFSLTLVKGQGCTGTMSEGTAGSFQIVMVGKTVWIKPDRAFWKSNGGNDPATLSIVSGKYVKDTAGTGLGAMSTLCDLDNWIGAIDQATGMVKGMTATVNGQRALQLKDTGDTASAFVSDTAKPVLVRLADPSPGGGTFNFTGYGAVTAITAPPASQTLDGRKYGL